MDWKFAARLSEVIPASAQGALGGWGGKNGAYRRFFLCAGVVSTGVGWPGDVWASERLDLLGMELGIDYELKKKGLSNTPKSLISLMASPRVLPVYPSCYLRLREHHNYVEFSPSRRHRKPVLVLVIDVSIGI